MVRNTVKNAILVLRILLKSALKMHAGNTVSDSQNFPGGLPPDRPRILGLCPRVTA